MKIAPNFTNIRRTLETQKTRGSGIQIKRCRRSRIILFFPNSQIQVKHHLCNCKNCSSGLLNDCMFETINSVLDEELLSLDETDDLATEMYTLITESLCVAVYSDQNSLELFYLIKVENKCVADEDMSDVYGHLIQKGSEFCSGYYLEKIREKGEYIYYKLLRKLVYFLSW